MCHRYLYRLWLLAGKARWPGRKRGQEYRETAFRYSVIIVVLYFAYFGLESGDCVRHANNFFEFLIRQLYARRSQSFGHPGDLSGVLDI